jgi:hypothetical protein
MAIDNNLKIDELSFDGIKSNFKNYLRAQDQFRDYNFDGAGISVLLDLLAYNTYYNSFYLNMVASESFLSTAQKRNSVVNLAKSLNYTPRSVTSSSISGTINVTTTGSSAAILIPAYTKFSGIIDGKTYIFSNVDAKTLYNVSGAYTGTVTLKEGSLIKTRYTVNSSDMEQRFLIPNQNIDTTTLTVSVLNSSSDSTSKTFTPADNLVSLNSTSQVYFIEEVEDRQYQVKFGDGIFGMGLDNGNVVVLSYLVSNGTSANDINALTFNDSIAGVASITFTATDPASGGADIETTAQIKFNAPKTYESQNRAVTADDYKALLLKQSTVDSVVVWGGEDNDPPTYGKVYIAIKPTSGEVLTPTEKNNLIKSVINPKKILTISTEIVDPEYLYIIMTSTVKYEANKTILSSDDLIDLVTSTIQSYNTDEINQFGKYFRYSKLSRLIDMSEASILNNDTSTLMRKELNVQLNIPTKYEINFSNAIDNASDGRSTTQPFGIGNKIYSNVFSYAGYDTCRLDENNGIIRIYRTEKNESIAVLLNAGSVNYSTGKIILNSFTPTAFADGGNTLKLTATPANKDILPLRNQILSIRSEDITVNMIDDKSISLVNR